MTLASDLAPSIPGVSPDIYSPQDFAAVSKIVHDVAGIVLPQGKAMLVYSRLAPLVRASGLITFSKYVDHLRANPKELNRAVAALTTNHTFFYREAHHFEHLQQELRPRLVKTLAGGGKVRGWSAGCSSGEETWSVIMTLLGPDRHAGLQFAKADFRYLASDLAPHAIEAGERGVYPAKDLKPVPEVLRKAWTSEKEDMVSIGDTARSLVRFRLLNLLGDWPIKGHFDFIFCRNVMIYFDNPTKERLVQRFCEALHPGGFLYIGHSERVTGRAADELTLVGPTIYRRRGA
ncbi:protein-glutamate O-methyltransferase CheR [Novosphingobium sp. 1949]|uniref:Chemotaxis protein methyltransferase n=1 Tax=Novosphingobium organovorum TaxID=2930092 RepID=A0ABT0BH00_9SPHN|nr:protein-glutamate O-methyltransferase CheR [Novosphingobium organovorum]MCJ2184347.1 protein-glutamate O-methyltransferase CheR [Novosphingobium organovorum]